MQMCRRLDAAMDRAQRDLVQALRVDRQKLGRLGRATLQTGAQCHRRGVLPMAMVEPFALVGATGCHMTPQIVDHPLEPCGQRTGG